MKTRTPFLEKLQYRQQQGTLGTTPLIRRVAEGTSPPKPLGRAASDRKLSASYREPFPRINRGLGHSSSVLFAEHHAIEVERGT